MTLFFLKDTILFGKLKVRTRTASGFYAELLELINLFSTYTCPTAFLVSNFCPTNEQFSLSHEKFATQTSPYNALANFCLGIEKYS